MQQLNFGRGTLLNPISRFESIVPSEEFCEDDPSIEEDQISPQTVIHFDSSKSILSFSDSPDLGERVTINPYRGCEHGCIYCFARPTHNYLGFSSGLDFETQIVAKKNAAILLEKEFNKKKYLVKPIGLGSNTDPYQPVERKLQITRNLLQLCMKYRHPVAIVTKSALVLRDLDILQELAKQDLIQVFLSVTTLDSQLSRKMEPRAAVPAKRLGVIETLTEARIPTGVLLAPLIPAINDYELEAILTKAATAGAQWAGYVMLRLPFDIKDLFYNWLQQNFPLKFAKVQNLIHAMRHGKDYDAQFGQRMRGDGPYAEMISRRFELACRRLQLNQELFSLNCENFKRLSEQPELNF